MGFDIPMKTTGAMDSSSLLSLNRGGASSQAQQPIQNTMDNSATYQQPAFEQQATQNTYGQQMQAQQNTYGQQPVQQVQQQNYNQQFSQPQPQAVQSQVQQTKQRPAGTGVRLKKGQKFGLAGANGSALSNIKVALGWDITNQQCDLDSSAFMLGVDGRVLGDDWFVFYGSTTSPDGSVRHSGDSQGAGDGDDEIINVNLQRVNQQVEKIVFVVTINEALELGLNFSMVANAYIRIVNADNNQELARFDLTNYYSNVTSMMVGELYRRNGEWKFNPIGDGISADLMGLCERYGVNVAD